MSLTPEQLKRLRRDQSHGNRLQVARQLCKLTQQQLAAQIGVTQGFISDIERQRYPNTALDTARKFADFFGCAIEDLFPSKAAVA